MPQPFRERRRDPRTNPARSLSHLLRTRASRDGWSMLACGEPGGALRAASCSPERARPLFGSADRPEQAPAQGDLPLTQRWDTPAGLSLHTASLSVAGQGVLLVGLEEPWSEQREHVRSKRLIDTAWRAAVIQLEERLAAAC
ncbi:MAG TPA: hypothetical protein DEA08_34140 [Planctomycetes bacterium]|nr:hypothetical protein [Planctomycetota bacterium]